MIHCIAIDDEPIALDVIKNHVSKVPFLNLAKTFRSAIDAIEYLQKNDVELIFLDINMPEISGIEFLDLLENSPLIIFTTAYSEYAVKGYEYDAVYYLVKPFNFQEFMKAVTKANAVLNKRQTKNEQVNTNTTSELLVNIKSGLQTHQIKVNDILYLKKDGGYVFFHFRDEKKLLARLSINEILDMLPANKFSRVHKSYIVALEKINIYENHQIHIDGVKIPIGNTYKEEFLKKIE